MCVCVDLPVVLEEALEEDNQLGVEHEQSVAMAEQPKTRNTEIQATVYKATLSYSCILYGYLSLLS